jgi:hypothetical protein
MDFFSLIAMSFLVPLFVGVAREAADDHAVILIVHLHDGLLLQETIVELIEEAFNEFLA